MSPSYFSYYAPELMIALFLAFFAVGLIVGYLMWSAKRALAIEAETENEGLRGQLASLKQENNKLTEMSTFH